MHKSLRHLFLVLSSIAIAGCAIRPESVRRPNPNTGKDVAATLIKKTFLGITYNEYIKYPIAEKTSAEISAESRNGLQSEMDRLLVYSIISISIGIAGAIAAMLIGNKIWQTIGFIFFCLGIGGAAGSLIGLVISIYWIVAIPLIGVIIICGIGVLIYKMKDFSLKTFKEHKK